MPLRRTTAPATLPLAVADVRGHVEAIGTVHDEKLEAMLTAIVEQLDGKDGILGRALVTQEWELMLDTFPCASTIKVPLPPLQSVESITYVDTAGATQTLPTSVYAVDIASEPGVVSLKYAQVWPATINQRNAVTIAFTCGYGAAEAVPGRLKAAIKLMVGDLFENREASILGVSRVDNPTVDSLLFPFRVL